MCTRPLKAFPVGVHDSGKTKYKVTSYGVEYVWNDRKSDVWYCSSDKPVFSPNCRIVTEYVEIPCGHCIECRLKYSREWANRCMLESKYHDSTLFITLTYDNDHLPPCNEYIDYNTAEILESPIHPLCKRDVQLFMKRLRKKYCDQKIRFYGCGEYGSLNMRPHYHLILFGLSIDDLVPAYKNELQNQFYTSETIAKLWPFGFHSIAPATWETCAYTARYVTKKLQGELSSVYEYYNFPREFSLCSRKPGIARQYYDEHVKEIYDVNKIYISTEKGGLSFKPPRYFDKLYDIDYPELASDRKQEIKAIAESCKLLKGNLTSLSYLDMLQSKERNIVARTKALKRSL